MYGRTSLNHGQDSRRINEIHYEKRSQRDAQISFVMSKIENMPESNHTDGIQKKEVYQEEAESSKNGEISKKFTIFFKWVYLL